MTVFFLLRYQFGQALISRNPLVFRSDPEPAGPLWGGRGGLLVRQDSPAQGKTRREASHQVQYKGAEVAYWSAKTLLPRARPGEKLVTRYSSSLWCRLFRVPLCWITAVSIIKSGLDPVLDSCCIQQFSRCLGLIPHMGKKCQAVRGQLWILSMRDLHSRE